jgi:hypothetical protein
MKDYANNLTLVVDEDLSIRRREGKGNARKDLHLKDKTWKNTLRRRSPSLVNSDGGMPENLGGRRESKIKRNEKGM